MKGIGNDFRTIPIKYLKGKHSVNFVILEFQGKLNISKMNLETGEIITSESIDDYNNTKIGKLTNFENIVKSSYNSEMSFIDALMEYSKNNPIELKIGYYSLLGKIVKLQKPLAVIQNTLNVKETLNIYDIIYYKIVFEKRPHFSN